MDTEKDTQAPEGDAAEDTEAEGWHVNQAVPAEDTEGQVWNPVRQAIPDDKDDKAEDTEGQVWNPVRQ